jgi:superfamily II DNA/RNA helicase
VEHVIQFDFPRFISDYIHREGHVGRIRSKRPGKVSSFVARPYEINLAQKIEVIGINESNT